MKKPLLTAMVFMLLAAVPVLIDEGHVWAGIITFFCLYAIYLIEFNGEFFIKSIDEKWKQKNKQKQESYKKADIYKKPITDYSFMERVRIGKEDFKREHDNCNQKRGSP